jgi:hypothetical protein
MSVPEPIESSSVPFALLTERQRRVWDLFLRVGVRAVQRLEKPSELDQTHAPTAMEVRRAPAERPPAA